jgi:hypothetical protein
VLPDLVRSGLRLGTLILLLGLASLFFLQPTTAEFWASAVAVGVALLFIGGLILVMSITHQSPPGRG